MSTTRLNFFETKSIRDRCRIYFLFLSKTLY